MGSPNWEFDEHFSSLQDKDDSLDDTSSYLDEVEEELYYQVYFDRTEDSKLVESTSFKIEEVSDDIENEDDNNENESSNTSKKRKKNSGKSSKISESLEIAGMSITELKKILKQNDNISETASPHFSSKNVSSGSEDGESDVNEDNDNDDDDGDDNKDTDEDDSMVYTDDDDIKTEDMKFNFNGLDNPDDEELLKILKNMPDSSSSWKVDEKVVESYMKSKANCHNCNEKGHMSYSCPNPKKRNRCILCSKEGHHMNKCPEQSCFRCHQEGHSFKQCSAASVKDLRCLRCCQRGHLVMGCPDVWRQYHMTTGKRGAVAGQSGSKMGATKCCFNCAREGHIAFHCNDRRKNTITSPFIFKYDWEGRHNTNKIEPTQNKYNSSGYNNNISNNYSSNRTNNNLFKDNKTECKKSTHVVYGTTLFNDTDDRYKSKHDSNLTPSTSLSKRGFINKLVNNNEIVKRHKNSYRDNNRNTSKKTGPPNKKDNNNKSLGDNVIYVVGSSDDDKYSRDAKEKTLFDRYKKAYDLHTKKIENNPKTPNKQEKGNKPEKRNKTEMGENADYIALKVYVGKEKGVRRVRSDANLLNALEESVIPSTSKGTNNNIKINNSNQNITYNNNNKISNSNNISESLMTEFKKKRNFVKYTTTQSTTINKFTKFTNPYMNSHVDQDMQNGYNDQNKHVNQRMKGKMAPKKRLQEGEDFPRGTESRKISRNKNHGGEFLKFSQVNQPNFSQPIHPNHFFKHASNQEYHTNYDYNQSIYKNK